MQFRHWYEQLIVLFMTSLRPVERVFKVITVILFLFVKPVCCLSLVVRTMGTQEFDGSNRQPWSKEEIVGLDEE